MVAQFALQCIQLKSIHTNFQNFEVKVARKIGSDQIMSHFQSLKTYVFKKSKEITLAKKNKASPLPV